VSEVSVGYGPLAPIDGPPPAAPLYGLLQAAEAPAAGVRIVPDADDRGIERWLNGVEVHPYPVTQAEVWDACRSGSEGGTKSEGDAVPLPDFGAMTVYLTDQCTAYQVPDDAAFKARAALALAAVEGAAVEREFLTGDTLLLNPHLSDGNGDFPNGDTATSPQNGLALLEAEIARSGKQGLVHVSPQVQTFLRDHLAIDLKNGIWRTANGIVVIPGFGYVDGATPTGHAAPGATEHWIYATGPIDIRRSEIFVLPETRAEALDRGVGATNDRPNLITYRAERYYLVDWDTDVQAAVLVDRCQTDC
jgi:hypothetical protein